MRLTFFFALLVLGACRKPPPPPPSLECVACHPAQVASAQRSHHAHAQERLARPLGPARLEGFTIDHDDGGSWLEWNEDAGVRRGSIVTLVGVDPVRQLVVESGNGLHVPPLGLLSDGGWLRLPVPEGRSFDWRGPAFSWNGSCAPCHATGFQPGLLEDGGSASRFDSFAVSCRACHPDEAEHLRWLTGGRPSAPHAGFRSSLQSTRTITFTDGGATASLGPPPSRDEQLERCASCHARARPLTRGGLSTDPFLDRFEPSLLEPGLYSSAGEVRDEVFEVGSFLQSPMHRAGVRCTDCHEPHEGTLLAPIPVLCGRCHRLEVFDSPEHHQHRTVGCEGCHLPTKTFLGVDVRHDHSLRRPTKDVCLGCHSSLPAHQLRLRAPETFEAAFGDRADAQRRVEAVVRDPSVPSFERASAIAAGRWFGSSRGLLKEQASSSDEWVRYGVARALGGVPAEQRAEVGGALLDDERRAVRVQAARSLAGLVPVPPAVAREVEEAERVNAFRGDAWLNLSEWRGRQGDARGAEAALHEGLARDPGFVPLLINLADRRRAESVRLLEAPARTPGPFQSQATFALALALWRAKDPARARVAFAEAARDGQTLHLVNWCLSEREAGGPARGWAVWELALARRPGNLDLLDLAEAWLRQTPDARWQARLDAERWHWNQ